MLNETRLAASLLILVVAFKDYILSLFYSGGEVKDVLDLLSQNLLFLFFCLLHLTPLNVSLLCTVCLGPADPPLGLPRTFPAPASCTKMTL